MSIEKYVEVGCDNCHEGNHAYGGSVESAKQQLRPNGIIFSKLGEFCSKKCFEEFKLKN